MPFSVQLNENLYLQLVWDLSSFKKSTLYTQIYIDTLSTELYKDSMGNDVFINMRLEEYSNKLKSRLDQILLSVSEKAQIDSGEETMSTLERLSAHLANCKVYIETIDYQQVNNPSFMRVHLDTLSRSVESLYRLSSMLDSQAESSPVLTLIERI